MKSYTITVNGNVYEVTVEENVGGVAKAAPVAAPKAAPVAKPATPAAAPKAAPKPAAPSGAEGGIKVTAPMPGKIIATKVTAGQSVKKGDVVVILEAMKMENEIVASQDGTIATVNVSAGSAVEAGDVLVTLN